MASDLRTTVFVSYSRKDSEWLDRLRVHLKPLERDKGVRVFVDTDIDPGELWKEKIAKALESAKVAVLLVSANFLASDYIAKQELPPLLKAAQSAGVVILPMIISWCQFEQTEGLREFQAVNPPSEPIINMTPGAQERTFNNLANRIAEVFAANSKTDVGPEIEPQEEEVPKGSDQVFHPGKWSLTRSALEECRFFVSPFYQKTKLWTLYGDIQVELRHDSSGEKVFLIPSGAVSPHLRETAYLRSQDGESIVNKKRDAAEKFVKEWRNQEMLGYKFSMITRTGETRTKVYCAAYDACLAKISDALDGESD